MPVKKKDTDTPVINEYPPTRYDSSILFKYGDRVKIKWYDAPDDYTVDSLYNNGRFYDWLEWTVVWISYNYHHRLPWDIIEAIYKVELDELDIDDCCIYFLGSNIELLEEDDNDGRMYKFTNEVEDWELKDFIEVADKSLSDIEYTDEEKKDWARKLKKCLNLAKEKLDE